MFWNSTPNPNRDLTCSFSPAMTLGVIFPEQESPLITSHCSIWSKPVLKAPLQFWQKDVHKVIYSTDFPHPSNDHSAMNAHSPSEADLNFSLSLRLRGTQPKSFPTSHLCFIQSIDQSFKNGWLFYWKFTAKGSCYAPWKFSVTKTPINYWDWDGRSHFMGSFQQVRRGWKIMDNKIRFL